jgi:hypothetical protein
MLRVVAERSEPLTAAEQYDAAKEIAHIALGLEAVELYRLLEMARKLSATPVRGLRPRPA